MIPVLAAAFLLASTAPADAQLVAPTPASPKAPKFEFAKLDPEAPPAAEWKASAQAGLIHASGNARGTTVSGGAKASRRDRRNRILLDVNGAYIRSSIFLAADVNGDGFIDADEITRPSRTSARGWESKLRYDRFLTTNNSLYAAALLSSDKPAGKQMVGGAQGGYSRQLFKNDCHEVVAEAGYDFSYERFVGRDNGVAIHSARAFFGYVGKLQGDTALIAQAEVLSNANALDTPGGRISRLEDTRLNGKLEITTELWRQINFSFSFIARFDNAPSPRPAFDIPYAPGFVPLADKLDTITRASLIINFL
jgi:hypothetical protein